MTPELIEREIAALGAVEAALRDERQALEARDAAALLAATERKAAALAAVAELTAGREPPAAGPADASGTPRHAALRLLARRCRELNDANGALIRAQRQRVEGLLALLTGGTATAPATYQADGTRASARRALRGPLATA
jgi:flagellar biosynthesis/type III secretory pathway chaperone